jgi:hypothetical protein
MVSPVHDSVTVKQHEEGFFHRPIITEGG